jgi:hypothetical protein
MKEHVIRLRNGWESMALDSPDSPSQRVTLPLAAGREGASRLLLTRRFGCPALNPGRESLWLRLESFAGLASLRLNGRELTLGPDAHDAIEIPLERLPARNLLALELSNALLPPDGSRGDHVACGEIALLIRMEPG